MKAHLFIFLVSFLATQAVKASITCHSPRIKNQIKISKSSIVFHHNPNDLDSRSIASISVEGVRTRKSSHGFTKIIFFEGKKHTIHIKNTSQFSDLNDYITIRSQKGHEILYPLSCQNS